MVFMMVMIRFLSRGKRVGGDWNGTLHQAYYVSFSFFACSRGELQRESDFMASVDSSWISWGVGVFLLKPLKWTLSNMLGDNKVPAEEVLVAVELLKVGAQKGEVMTGSSTFLCLSLEKEHIFFYMRTGLITDLL